jgi:hypothetical protein
MKIKKFQEGGAAPAAPAQPTQGADEQAMQQLAQMAQSIIEQLGPEAAAMLAQIIMEMLQGVAQGPVGQPQEGQAFMRKGGKLVKCSGKMKSKKACDGTKLGK